MPNHVKSHEPKLFICVMEYDAGMTTQSQLASKGQVAQWQSGVDDHGLAQDHQDI